MTRSITDLLNGIMKEKKSGPFNWTKKTDKAFRLLKDLFTSVSILRMFDLTLRTRLETDISGFTIGAIIFQFFDSFRGRKV